MVVNAFSPVLERQLYEFKASLACIGSSQSVKTYSQRDGGGGRRRIET